VKRLMEISPRNLSDPEVEMWPEKMVQSAMDDVTEDDIRESIERGESKHRPEIFLALLACRLFGLLTALFLPCLCVPGGPCRACGEVTATQMLTPNPKHHTLNPVPGGPCRACGEVTATQMLNPNP
jgi:hypothetical protein